MACWVMTDIPRDKRMTRTPRVDIVLYGVSSTSVKGAAEPPGVDESGQETEVIQQALDLPSRNMLDCSPVVKIGTTATLPGL
jgi:hypothetical protein